MGSNDAVLATSSGSFRGKVHGLWRKLANSYKTWPSKIEVYFQPIFLTTLIKKLVKKELHIIFVLMFPDGNCLTDAPRLMRAYD